VRSWWRGQGADELAGGGGQPVGALVAGLVAVDDERPVVADSQRGETELGGVVAKLLGVSDHLGADGLGVGGQGVRHAHSPPVPALDSVLPSRAALSACIPRLVLPSFRRSPHRHHKVFNSKLQEWEDYYNYHRPHGGLRGQTPYERLHQKTQTQV
jgi:hypothetical protein